MAFMGSGRLLATAISALAAVAILSLAAWMLLGNSGPPQPADDAVRIIPSTAGAATGSAPAPAAPDSQSAAPPAPGPTAPPAKIVVHLTGAVINPGVYETAPNQRLNDVLQMAGGPAPDADLSGVNLAAYVKDATQYRIPSVADAAPAPAAMESAAMESAAMASGGTVTNGTAANGTSSAATACAEPVNINTATADCLTTLPGIGSVKAQSIVDYREQSGPFVATDQITAVSGIGSATYRRIAALITVGGP